MAVYGREDDLVLALREANQALASNGRFGLTPGVDGEVTDMATAHRVTEIADVYVAWLRRIKTAKLTLVAIEELATGKIASTPMEGTQVTNIDTSQRARYSVTAKDDRGFTADYALGARASDAEVVLVEYFNVGDAANTSNGTVNADGSSAELDQVLATFNGKLGTSTVEVFDPAVPDVVLFSDVVVANPGQVASASLSAAVIEEIPAPPAPAPAP